MRYYSSSLIGLVFLCACGEAASDSEANPEPPTGERTDDAAEATSRSESGDEGGGGRSHLGEGSGGDQALGGSANAGGSAGSGGSESAGGSASASAGGSANAGGGSSAGGSPATGGSASSGGSTSSGGTGSLGPPDTFRVPVQFHILQNSSGTLAEDPDAVLAAQSQLVDAFGEHDITFSFGPLNIIQSDEWFNATGPTGVSQMVIANRVEGALDVFLVNDLLHVGGAGYFAPGEGGYVIASETELRTVGHEIGHYFSLDHTHDTFPGGPELVDGSNCETAGDEICDTPADPNLARAGFSTSSCTYVGITYDASTGIVSDVVDANGDKYQPDVHNIMSYAGGLCRTRFTAGQAGKMRDYFMSTAYPWFSSAPF